MLWHLPGGVPQALEFVCVVLDNCAHTFLCNCARVRIFVSVTTVIAPHYFCMCVFMQACIRFVIGLRARTFHFAYAKALIVAAVNANACNGTRIRMRSNGCFRRKRFTSWQRKLLFPV